MCGLSGIILDKAASSYGYDTEKLMQHLLNFNTVRGKDSTGVFVVDTDGDVTDVKYVKETIPGNQFVGHKTYSTIAGKFPFAQAIMGHNRHGTMGGNTREAAHPHTSEDVVLAHNGTLVKFEHLARTSLGMNDLDSARITYQIQDKGSNTALFDELHGAYALTWVDTRTHKVYIARNDQRSLYWTIFDRDMFVYASSAWMLHGAAEATRINMSCPVKEFPVGELWEFDPLEFSINKGKAQGDIEFDGLEITKFTPQQSVSEPYSYKMFAGSYTAAVNSTNSQRSALSKEVENSNKLLASANLTVGSETEIYLDSVYYGKGKDATKKGLGYAYTTSKPSHQVVVLDVDKDDIEDNAYSWDAVILGCTSIKGNMTIYAALTGVNKMEVDAVEYSRIMCGDDTHAAEIRRLFGDRLVLSTDPEVEEELISLPSGITLSQKMYQTLLNTGCSECDNDVDDVNVFWTQDNHPICTDCNASRTARWLHREESSIKEAS